MSARLFACLVALTVAAGCTPDAPQETASPSTDTAAAPAAAQQPQPAAAGPSAPPLAATVLGEEIRTADAGEMQQFVLTRLFDRYAAEHGVEASNDEVDAYVERMQRAMAEDPNFTAGDDLTPEEAAQVDAMRREMGRSMIRQWKLNRALYQQYGGRVIYQQLGPEPVDAYRQYLEERQAAGDFTLHEKAFESGFWRYFTDDSMHDFFEPGSEGSAFEIPPWERGEAE
jgi:hypothetical protein